MVPRSPQYLYKILAERNPDVDEKHIKELVVAFYRHVRRMLTSLDHGVVSVPGLGIFYIKPNVLEREEKKFSTWEESRMPIVRENRRLQYQKIQMLQEFFRIEAGKKKEKRRLRNEYLDAKQKLVDNEQAKEPVETQSGDSRRMVELPDREQGAEGSSQQETEDMQE